MKKLLLVLLMIVYGASAFGTTVHFHFCCGKLKSVNFSPATHKGCMAEGKEAMEDCCKDKAVKLELSGDQHSAKYVALSAAAGTAVVAPFSGFTAQPLQEPLVVPHIFAPPPPLLSAQPLFILHCLFRI